MTDGTDVGEAVAAIGLGILGGIALGAILSALFGHKCPVCHAPISYGANPCPHCHTVLRWG